MQGPSEFNDQNAIRDYDAGHHDHAHQGHNVQRAPGDEKDQHDPSQSRRDRHENDEGIDERSELGHQDQVDHQDRNDESNSKLRKRSVHANHRSTQIQNSILVGLRVVEKLPDVATYTLQCLCLGGNVDVNDASDL